MQRVVVLFTKIVMIREKLLKVEVQDNLTNTGYYIGKYFFIILLAIISLGLITDMGYWLIGKWVANFPKLFFYPAIIIMVCSFMIRMKIPDDIFIKYMLIYGPVVVIYGLFCNPFNKATLAHLFPLSLPILGISFGYFLAKEQPATFQYFHSKIFSAGYILSFMTIIYFFLVYLGYIPYYGAGVLFAYPVFYSALKRKYFLLLLFIVAATLTGKRSVLLAILAVLFLYYFVNFQNKKRLIYGLLVIFLVSFFLFGVYHANIGSDYGMMGRYFRFIDAVVGFDPDNYNLDLLNEVTSGRIYDALAAYDAVDDNALNIAFGRGLGATFTFFYGEDNIKFTTHYSHFTPIAYLFLGGLFLAIPVYLKLLSLLYYSVINKKSLYSMLFIYYFIMGLIGGAIFFTDPFVWFVTGVVLYQKEHNKVSLPHLYL
ncbi:hypothetical protein M3P05_19135 [Sansalvadorimonas sp. 2012CJ34-2]|uniref:Uncharacterized protein n=1 Tax=Parendozoicomonas callyspongiae TaxID=2942213 RepID=A0ABT0PKZ4_9GAMM|nr:hypothetical protein [Sansalvadorimonas sp. 2012CJ34-2]MCL6272040.1 hypothetical protein [Sansalvadorimonas sp. 2012CJ34-2]